VIEGLAIAAMTVRATRAFLAVKASSTLEARILRRAMAEMQAAGLAGDVPISLVLGPHSYLFGEEKALLEVIEREDPLPRRDPPYLHGLFASGAQMGWSARDGVDAGGDTANPTIVNNLENLAAVPHILRNGAEWYRALGTWDSPGTMVFIVVGDVVRPGCAELELGTTTLRDVIERVGGGSRPGRTVKAVFSGVANGVITADNLDVPATYEDLAAIGSGLGFAGFIVYDDTADMVAVARISLAFCMSSRAGSAARRMIARSRTVVGRALDLSGGSGDAAQTDPQAQLQLGRRIRWWCRTGLSGWWEGLANAGPPLPLGLAL
jgi:NADH-quinone oxidoreductase subunit F